MRKKIVAGNWKMNNTCSAGLALFNEINSLLKQGTDNLVKVIILPAFIFIRELAAQSSRIAIGAQDCSAEASGAYTGEVSAGMIESAGAEYVIIGHSERRTYFGETNSILAKKIDISLQNNLTPIYCIGETLDERNSKNHFDVIHKQLADGVFHLGIEGFSKIIIAYEPVWAIGTGVTASTAQAQEMHTFIRKTIMQKYGELTADSCSILYGGSCNPQNAKELFRCPDIDGGLIGGASLKAADFVEIINSF